jgi:IBR domain, a half RING-finger domain/Zinc finger, C3HC4 type (RING finger)
VGTGGRAFHGSLVPVEAARQYDEECKFLNLQTITTVYDLNKWSMEELRLQDYYHGYKYGKPAGVPQSSNKRSFDGFSGFIGGLFTGPAATKLKLDSGALVKMMKCVICLEKMPKHDCITIKCGHVYCRGCIRQLFARSLSDPELFPPRCCKEAIPYEQVLFLFPGHFKQRFDERLEEFNTVDPIYCPTVNCGHFLAPRTFNPNNTTSCKKCKENTCTKCRAKAHGQKNCPADKDFEELRRFGKDSNWQICFRCKNLVELQMGCYHITLVHSITSIILAKLTHIAVAVVPSSATSVVYHGQRIPRLVPVRTLTKLIL